MRPDEELPLSRQLPVDEDVRRELAHHLEERQKELIARGMDPAAARAEAERSFGNIAAVQVECRDITRRSRRASRRARMIDGFYQDIVLAGRLLLKTPAYTLAAVLTLALGIGANAAIFSVVNAALLRPLPFQRPEQIVDLLQTSERGVSNIPHANMLDFRSQSRSFESMAAYARGPSTVLTSNGPTNAREASVTEDFFKVLRVTPALGRLPTPEEHRVGAIPVAVISHSFWTRVFDQSTDFAAQRIRTDREYQVIGVMPEGFGFPDNNDIWHPLEIFGITTSRTAHNEWTIARLRDGSTVEMADRELDAMTQELKAKYSPDFDAEGALVQTLQSRMTTNTRKPLILLLGASALLLLTACTNLASTMLARGMARQQEMAVRLAIGAGRLRIVRQLFTESLLLALLGCTVGLLIAHGLLGIFTHLAPANLRLSTIHLDGWVLLFTGLVGVTTTLLIGLFPALRTSDASPGLVMRQGGRSGRGRAERRIWGSLVVAEVALAVTLLAGSVLLIRSFDRVMAVDPGFRIDSLLTIEIDLPTSVYNNELRLEQTWTRALDAIRARSDVEWAGIITALPLTNNNPSGSFGIEGVPPGPAGYGPGNGGYRMVSDNYFAAMGIPVLRGRDFDNRDVAGAQATVIVNQALVDRFFQDVDPLGRQIRLQSGMDSHGDNWLTIIGIVGNVRHSGLTRQAAPEYYVPLHQRPSRGYSGYILVRPKGDPVALVQPMRAIVKEIMPEVLPGFVMMEDRLSQSLTDRRFTTVILGAFAVISLLLAAVGIYGVVSYTAVQRTREVGIRLALGATPREVRGMVQRQALVQVLIGLGIGTLGALAATRGMQSMLYEVGAADPRSFVTAALLLLVTAWLASFIPAWRAARLDPALTMRSE